MIVAEIKAISKKKSKILIEGGLAFALYNGELGKYKISLGDDIEYTYTDKLHPLLLKRAKERILYILKDSDKTESQLREKLKEGCYPDDIIAATIDWAKDKHYIDDLRYASYYAEGRAVKKSKRAIMQDMLKKGFEKDIIEQTLDGMDFDEKEQIEAFIKKKCPDIASINHEKKAKLVASLMRRGYSYEDIRDVIKDWMED